MLARLAARHVAAAMFAFAPLCAQATTPPTADAPATAPAPAAPAITPLAHVEERGAGATTLILVPGLSCDWTVYASFLERNKERYRMLAVTLPGFGGSAAPPLAEGAELVDAAWLRNAAAAILDLASARKLERPIVVGHSLGGHLAMRMALDAPDRLGGAISIDGLPLYPPPPSMPSEPKARAALARNMVARMAATPPEAWQKQQLATMKSMVTDADRAAQLAALCGAVPPATSARYMGEMMLSDLRARLADAKVPVLAISAVASDMGEAFAKAIRGGVAAQFAKASPQVTLAPFDCRHFVMDDKPAELDAAVEAFVAKLAAAK